MPLCCNITKLLEHRLENQNTIPNSLAEFGAADAEIIVSYDNEPALRPDFSGWELTRLAIALKLPPTVVEALRTKFGVSCNLDVIGPNTFILLQSVNSDETRGGDWAEDYPENLVNGLVNGLNVSGEGSIRPCIFDTSAVWY